MKALFDDDAEGPDRSVRLDRRLRPERHARRGRQPPVPRDVQGTRRPQLRRVRPREPDQRAGARGRQDCRRSRCRRSRGPRSTSGGSAAAPRSTRFRSRPGWRSTCDRRARRRWRRSTQRFQTAVDCGGRRGEPAMARPGVDYGRHGARRRSARRRNALVVAHRADGAGGRPDARTPAGARRRLDRCQPSDQPQDSGDHDRRRRIRGERVTRSPNRSTRPMRGRARRTRSSSPSR